MQLIANCLLQQQQCTDG